MSGLASIVAPIYRAERTLGRHLECLRAQRHRHFELILVDSSPDAGCGHIVQRAYPGARYIKSEIRLLPHGASNLGAQRAKGENLVFIDPDAYARPDWLERLLAAGADGEGAVIGGVACYGRAWIDQGAHLCKFDKWLPGGQPRQIEEGPSVNFMIPRQLFKLLGGFPRGTRHGDTVLCWKVRRQGLPIRFEPSAVVEHHHLHSWASLVRERYARGIGFGALEMDQQPSARRLRMVGRLAASLLPLRLASQSMRVLANARQAGMLRIALLSWPVWSSGLYAWLLGESRSCARLLLAKKA